MAYQQQQQQVRETGRDRGEGELRNTWHCGPGLGVALCTLWQRRPYSLFNNNYCSLLAAIIVVSCVCAGNSIEIGRLLARASRAA